MRLFVALEIPAEVREKLAGLIVELRRAAEHSPGKAPRWVRPQNLHVTLKFIGEVEAARLSAFRSALAEVRSERPVTLQFRGLGHFPNEKNPRVLWTGIEA
ncbi:MAG: RNA 2',3'-cyclic phosphodiesterase, partial [Candidatus Acidiferrum sp.]